MSQEARPKVYVTRWIPEEGLNLLQNNPDLEVRVWEKDEPIPREILLREAADCDGILSMLTDRIDAELLDACPKVRVVSNCAVGYDNINVPQATERGVLVGNTPGVLTETTADLAFALILATARRIAEGVDYVKAGQWKTWSPLTMLGVDVHHATLGILGMGRIGREIAKRGRGFDMTILYHNRQRDEETERELGARYVSKEELLRQSDFVSVSVPLSPETRHYLKAEDFALMKPTAIVINTARGPVIDQAALYEAVRSGRIAGAGLDVTDPEPMQPDDPMLTLPQVTVIPHVGSATRRTRGRMAEIAARNLLAALKGETMISCVNSQALGTGRNARK
jgi:glyoxylate reductase